jgi:hypothetical protein
MSIPTERTLALAFVTVLAAELGATKVGYGKRPSGGGWASPTPSPTTPFAGYAVVWPGGTTASGPVAGHNDDGAQGVQVSYYGSSGEQADAMRDRGREAILSGTFTVTGRSVNLVELADSSPLTRDDEVQPPVFQSVDRFLAYTTPA